MRRRPLLVVSVVLVALAGCGAGSDEATATQVTTTEVAATEVTGGSSPSSTTVTEVLAPNPIPTDPSALGPCDELPAGALAATPSRRLPSPPDGWSISYASTTLDSPASPPATVTWATLAQADADGVVTALAVLSAQPSAGPAAEGPDAIALRGTTAVIAPEVTRGGPTGAIQASWTEAGLDHLVLARGVDATELEALVAGLDLEEGIVGSAPAGWDLLGAGGAARAAGGGAVTVIGLTPAGEPLEETGYAPVEVNVEEPVDGAAPPGVLRVGSGFTLDGGAVRIAEVNGRPALVVDLGDGRRLVDTTTDDGAPVQVAGPATVDELVAMAASALPVDVGDPRLVGVPMGAVGSSPGSWCR